MTIFSIFLIINSKIDYLIENENDSISSTDFKTYFNFFVDLFLTVFGFRQGPRFIVTYEGISPGKNYSRWNVAEHSGVSTLYHCEPAPLRAKLRPWSYWI